MKKLVLMALAPLTFIVAGSIALAAPDPLVIKKPTCEGWGETRVYYDQNVEPYDDLIYENGVYHRTQRVKPLNHLWDDEDYWKANKEDHIIEKVDPTCDKDGFIIYKCGRKTDDLFNIGIENDSRIVNIVCEETKKEVLPATGKHTWGWFPSYDKENEPALRPGCVGSSIMVEKCTVCGALSGNKKETVLQDHVWDLANHKYEADGANKGTCTEKEHYYVICKRCGQTSLEVEGKLREGDYNKDNHDWGAWQPVEGHQATCTEDGRRYRVCSRKGCEARQEEVAPKTGHDYDDGPYVYVSPVDGKEYTQPSWGRHFKEVVIVSDSTCKTVGKVRFKCPKCGKFETDEYVELNATNYKHENKQEAVVNYRYEYLTLIDHLKNEESPITITTEPDCIHVGKADYACARCGEVVWKDVAVHATGHASIEEIEKAAKTDPKAVVVVKEATCTEDGRKEWHCRRELEDENHTICDALIKSEVLPAKGHVWSEWKEQNPYVPGEAKDGGTLGYWIRVCTVCGATDYIIGDDSVNPLKPQEPVKPAIHFDDMATAEDWELEAVDYVVTNEYMIGKDPGKVFDPHAPITRAEFVKLLYNVAGKPTVEGTPKFTDVVTGEWYSNPIIWATEKGIVLGKGDIFDLSAPITREELVLMLCRYAATQGVDTKSDADLSKFSDADDVSTWAVDAVKWATESGIVEGNGNGTFDPQGSAMRVQCAAIIMRYFANGAK